MIVDNILKIADEAYPDECVSVVDASKGKDVGDTLATFIALELKDVCQFNVNEESATRECISAMDKAITQLQSVRDAISDYEDEQAEILRRDEKNGLYADRIDDSN